MSERCLKCGHSLPSRETIVEKLERLDKYYLGIQLRAGRREDWAICHDSEDAEIIAEAPSIEEVVDAALKTVGDGLPPSRYRKKG